MTGVPATLDVVAGATSQPDACKTKCCDLGHVGGSRRRENFTAEGVGARLRLQAPQAPDQFSNPSLGEWREAWSGATILVVADQGRLNLSVATPSEISSIRCFSIWMLLLMGGASSRALTTLLTERHARHLAGRAQTLQDARKPMHTDHSTNLMIDFIREQRRARGSR
jgi:hypothetical protein